MPYLAAAGWDEALEDLSPLKCATIGLQYARRQYAASGAVIDEGAYVELLYSTRNVTDYQADLALLGLDTAATSNVSVYIQDERFNWILRNGVAVLPQIGTDGERSGVFLKNMKILVKSLRAQA